MVCAPIRCIIDLPQLKKLAFSVRFKYINFRISASKIRRSVSGIRLDLNLEFAGHHNLSFCQAIEEAARISYEYDEEDFLLIKYSLKIAAANAEPGK